MAKCEWCGKKGCPGDCPEAKAAEEIRRAGQKIQPTDDPDLHQQRIDRATRTDTDGGR